MTSTDYGEPWRVMLGKDMYNDPEDDTYLGVGTRDASEPDIVCWEDEPSDKCKSIEARLVACVNALAGFPDDLLKDIADLLRLAAAIKALPGGHKIINHTGTTGEGIFGKWTVANINTETTVGSGDSPLAALGAALDKIYS